jgi:hypothetical protein
MDDCGGTIGTNIYAWHLLYMQPLIPRVIVDELEGLIDRVQTHIDAQRIQLFISEDIDEDKEMLRDMLQTLEHLQAYRERFYSTLH